MSTHSLCTYRPAQRSRAQPLRTAWPCLSFGRPPPLGIPCPHSRTRLPSLACRALTRTDASWVMAVTIPSRRTSVSPRDPATGHRRDSANRSRGSGSACRSTRRMSSGRRQGHRGLSRQRLLSHRRSSIGPPLLRDTPRGPPLLLGPPFPPRPRSPRLLGPLLLLGFPWPRTLRLSLPCSRLLLPLPPALLPSRGPSSWPRRRCGPNRPPSSCRVRGSHCSALGAHRCPGRRRGMSTSSRRPRPGSLRGPTLLTCPRRLPLRSWRPSTTLLLQGSSTFPPRRDCGLSGQLELLLLQLCLLLGVSFGGQDGAHGQADHTAGGGSRLGE